MSRAQLHYGSRRPQVADPTGDLAAYRDLLAEAHAWVYETDDPDERAARLALYIDARLDYAGQRANPTPGRHAQLDEAFSAMGYRDGSRA